VFSGGAGVSNDKVGVAVAAGAVGVVSAWGCAQALSARINSRQMIIFLFIVAPSVATIFAFFECDYKGHSSI
jgi:hypothetical protein